MAPGNASRNPWARSARIFRNFRLPGGLSSVNFATAALWAALAWAYWPILRELADRWSHDPRYSHGFLVPCFAAVLLWQRRGQLETAPSPSFAYAKCELSSGESLETKVSMA